MVVKLDIIQTLAVAVLVLFMGSFVKKHIKILEKLCIPDPVVGGIIFSILTLLGYSSGLCVLELDTTLQNVFMTVFFTAVGFTCDLKVLYKIWYEGNTVRDYRFPAGDIPKYNWCGLCKDV